MSPRSPQRSPSLLGKFVSRIVAGLGGAALLATITAAQEPPTLPRAITGSPGSLERVDAIASPCPAFSWGAFVGADRFELAALELPTGFDGGPGPGPETATTRVALHRELSGALRSWTPPPEDCLERGGRYAWFVRALDAAGRPVSEWSAPRLVEVPAVPSREELARALEVLDAYRRSIEGEPVDVQRVAVPTLVDERPSEGGDVTAASGSDVRVAQRTLSASVAQISTVQASTAALAAGVSAEVSAGGDGAMGVFGLANSASERVYGIYGEARSVDADAAGVFGTGSSGVQGEGGSFGVRGNTSSTSSSTAYGVLGTTASNGGSSAGVGGHSTGAAAGVRATAASTGPALRLEHSMAGGDLITSGSDVFTVDRDGDVIANSFSGDGSGLTNLSGVAAEAFRTVDAPAGTDPVADSASDTLTLTASGAVSVVGNETTDSVTFDVVDDSIDGTELADSITLDANLTLSSAMFGLALSAVSTSVNRLLLVANTTGAADADVVLVSKLSGGSASDGIRVVADDPAMNAAPPGDSASTRLAAAGTGSESTITDGIDVSHPGIVNAINVGDNTILGGAFSIVGSLFNVLSTGEVIASSLSLLGPPAPLGTVFFPPSPQPIGAMPGTVYFDFEADTLCLSTLNQGWVPLGSASAPCGGPPLPP